MVLNWDGSAAEYFSKYENHAKIDFEDPVKIIVFYWIFKTKNILILIFRNKFSSATNCNFYQPNLILPHWCRWSYGSLVIVLGIKVLRSLVQSLKKSFFKFYIKIPNFIYIFLLHFDRSEKYSAALPNQFITMQPSFVNEITCDNLA